MAGRVTRRKIWNGEAPSVAAACSCSSPISSRTGTSSRTTSGSDTKQVAMIMPGRAKIISMPWPSSQPPIEVFGP